MGNNSGTLGARGRGVVAGKGLAHRDGNGGRRASRGSRRIFAGTTADVKLGRLGVDDVGVGAVDGVAGEKSQRSWFI